MFFVSLAVASADVDDWQGFEDPGDSISQASSRNGAQTAEKTKASQSEKSAGTKSSKQKAHIIGAVRMNDSSISSSDIIRLLSRAVKDKEELVDSLKELIKSQENTIMQMQTMNSQLQELNTKLITENQVLSSELARHKQEKQDLQSATTLGTGSTFSMTSGIADNSGQSSIVFVQPEQNAQNQETQQLVVMMAILLWFRIFKEIMLSRKVKNRSRASI
jgi:hypothetical protein